MLSHTFFLLFSCIVIYLLTVVSVTSFPTEQTALFAGGCFWCLEAAFQSLEGVIDVKSGFCGGNLKNPTYKDVKSGITDHYETISIRYDPSKVSYDKLLATYWENIDPTDQGGQFKSRGSQYRTVIFYLNEQQKQKAQKSKRKLRQSGIYSQDIATRVLLAKQFYPAEDYHQDYYSKNSIKYTSCRQRTSPHSQIDSQL